VFKLKTIIKYFRFNPIVKTLLKLCGKQLNPNKWVFIIGCYNSGTTLLEKLLSQHPLISSLEDEGVILSGYLNRPEDFKWTRMWWKCYDKVKLTNQSEHKNLATNIKKHWSHFYDLGKSIFLEKSIVNTTRIPFFAKFFTPAYFIYIVRDGYAVSEGIRRKAEPLKYGNEKYSNGYPIEMCAQQWVVTDEIVQMNKKHCENFLQITYEELSENPESVLASIAEFLGIEPLNSNVFKNMYSIHEKHVKIQNMNNRSWNNLSDTDIDIIYNIAEPILRKHGYSRPK